MDLYVKCGAEFQNKKALFLAPETLQLPWGLQFS